MTRCLVCRDGATVVDAFAEQGIAVDVTRTPSPGAPVVASAPAGLVCRGRRRDGCGRTWFALRSCAPAGRSS